ncbi:MULTISPECIES: DUF6266 family protein [unclassified Sphingobacterium]|uniref:DUF6266 family protein n=1 Tax=unclassified Sphingobacterium TaxID=2609468 RepID=UPI001AE61DC6|nr:MULTISPECIES: DUF6266 family protein [unclassified Sphingobacterium]MDR6736922.1 hypothetical protein [Sphingobacterium sp. 2149]
MAVIKNGANGTLSGKAGSIVFVTNGNKTYARGLPKKSTKKPTVDQIQSRLRFSLIQKFSSSMLYLLRIGFKNYNPNKKAYSNAMSYNLNNAIEKTATGYAINYENFRISKGILNPITSYRFEIDKETETFTLFWDYDTKLSVASGLNASSCRLILSGPEELAFANEGMNTLLQQTQTVKLQRQEHIGTYHIYVFFHKSDGSDECTDSKYLGTVEW